MHFNLDTIIMLIYLAGMLILGLWCVRYIKSFDDFFVAGRRLGFFLSIGTMAALFVGGSAIGVAGMGHDYGIGAIWYYAAYAIGFTTLGLTFVVPLRAMGQYTVADIFAVRYDERVRLLSTVITFFAWIFFFAAFVVAGARVVEVLLGWDLRIAILVTAGIFTIYTSVGGMWAVTMTDFVQFVILITGILIIFPVAMVAVGGPEALFAATPPENTSLIPIFEGGTVWTGLGYVICTIVLTGSTGIVAPDIYLRVWCCKDDRTAKLTLYVVSALVVVFAFMLSMIGMAAKILNPEIAHEMALPWMVQTLLPHGLSGLVLVALMAAAISGAVPELVVCSSILARDLYQKLINPKADEKQLLKVSRLLTFLIGVIGMILAYLLPGFMDLTYQCYRIFVPAIAPICIAAFYSKKTTSKAALWSMAISIVVTTFCIIAFPETYLTMKDPLFIGLITSISTLLIFNHFTKPSEKDAEFVENALGLIADYKAGKKAAKAARIAARASKRA